MMIITTYVSTAILAYGLSFGTLQNMMPKYKDKDYWIDMFLAVIIGLFGPFGLAYILIDTLVYSDGYRSRLKFKLW
jgi:H+/Cl- antiporter ClcA